MKKVFLLVLSFVFLLTASCATMKKSSTDNLSGICKEDYDAAVQGEKEALAGTVLLPSGVGLFVVGFPLMVISGMYCDISPEECAKRDKNLYKNGPFISFAAMTGLGAAAIVAGIVLLVDGHVRVNNWNDYCTGATPAERYCLYDTVKTTP